MIYAVLLVIIGAVLIADSMLAPQYQHAEAYEAIEPFLAGLAAVIVGVFSAVMIWIIP